MNVAHRVFKRGLIGLSILLLSGLVSGCGDAPPRPFDFGKDVTQPPPTPNDDGSGDDGDNGSGDDNTTPPAFPSSKYCVPDANGVYPDAITLTSGKDQPPSEWWATGGACVHRNIREAWGVLHNVELIKWEGVDEIEFSRLNPPQADISHYYSIKYIVHDFITVSWTMEWVHALAEGTVENPVKVIARYQRVSGTRYVPFWEGYVQLEKLTDDVTGVQLLDRVKASQTGEEDSRGTVNDLIKWMRTGQPDFNRLDQ